MTGMRTTLGVALVAGLAGGWAVAPSLGAARQTAPPAGSDRPAVTKAQSEQWKTELSNWGRWGKEDQIGALNLVTPAKRRQAAGSSRTGSPYRWPAT